MGRLTHDVGQHLRGVAEQKGNCYVIVIFCLRLATTELICIMIN
jgi:hypothetical protein